MHTPVFGLQLLAWLLHLQGRHTGNPHCLGGHKLHWRPDARIAQLHWPVCWLQKLSDEPMLSHSQAATWKDHNDESFWGALESYSHTGNMNSFILTKDIKYVNRSVHMRASSLGEKFRNIPGSCSFSIHLIGWNEWIQPRDCDFAMDRNDHKSSIKSPPPPSKPQLSNKRPLSFTFCSVRYRQNHAKRKTSFVIFILASPLP